MNYYYNKTNDKQTAQQKAKYCTMLCTIFGSLLDIILTFTVVGIINRNDLIGSLFALYDEKCYSDDIELTIFDLQSQFETILILDVVEGCLDLSCLIILAFGYFKCKGETMEEVTQGIHGFIFGFFDLILISVNVFLFVIPTFNTFRDSYDNQNYLCYTTNTLQPTSMPTINPTTPMPTNYPTMPTLFPTSVPTSFPTSVPTLFSSTTPIVRAHFTSMISTLVPAPTNHGMFG